MGEWAIAVTKPNYEVRVESYLTRQGFCVYAPKISERVIAGGRLFHRQAPLFRRYIFVAARDAWMAIGRTFGVNGLLRGASNTPALLPDSIIEELRLRHNSDGFVQLPRFKAGDKVRITDGPFMGQLALYQGMTSRQRECVLLSALGCKVELTMGNLEAAV